MRNDVRTCTEHPVQCALMAQREFVVPEPWKKFGVDKKPGGTR